MRSNVDELPGLGRLAAQPRRDASSSSATCCPTRRTCSARRSTTQHGARWRAETTAAPRWQLPAFDWDRQIGAAARRRAARAPARSASSAPSAEATSPLPLRRGGRLRRRLARRRQPLPAAPAHLHLLRARTREADAALGGRAPARRVARRRSGPGPTTPPSATACGASTSRPAPTAAASSRRATRRTASATRTPPAATASGRVEWCAVPEVKRDYYEVLGVARTAELAEIKKAFRRLARDCHPDVNPEDPGAEARFKECAEAWEVLSDPEKRAAYDQHGLAGLRGRSMPDFQSAAFRDLYNVLLRDGRARHADAPVLHVSEVPARVPEAAQREGQGGRGRDRSSLSSPARLRRAPVLLVIRGQVLYVLDWHACDSRRSEPAPAIPPRLDEEGGADGRRVDDEDGQQREQAGRHGDDDQLRRSDGGEHQRQRAGKSPEAGSAFCATAAYQVCRCWTRVFMTAPLVRTYVRSDYSRISGDSRSSASPGGRIPRWPVDPRAAVMRR